MHQGPPQSELSLRLAGRESVSRIPLWRTVRKFLPEDVGAGQKSLNARLSKHISRQRTCETCFLEETGEDIAFVFREIAASPFRIHLGFNQNCLSPRSGKTCISDESHLL